MSLSTELTRMAQNVGALTADTNAIFEALRAKGVPVPANAQLSDVADMIEMIEVPITSVVIGGRSYPVVKIGNQLWMAENLDWKLDGITIGASGNPTTPSAWYYNNDEASYGINGTYKCGLLYNWYATKYLDDNKATLLPSGWHVPTSIEFDILVTNVGGTSTAGTKLKALNNSVTSDWPSNWNGTDDYGFSSLPVGSRGSGSFYNINTHSVLWTATDSSSSSAYAYFTTTDTSIHTYHVDNNKSDAFSLRLVKDIT